MLIDCDRCTARGAGCSDCVVSALLGSPAEGVELSEETRAAIDVLAAGGLAPPLRLALPDSATG